MYLLFGQWIGTETWNLGLSPKSCIVVRLSLYLLVNNKEKSAIFFFFKEQVLLDTSRSVIIIEN